MCPVEVKVKSREVTVKGPRGTLKRSFNHVGVDIYMLGRRKVQVDKWFGIRKQLAQVRTVCSHIENMIKGVTLVSASDTPLLSSRSTYDRATPILQ